MQLIDQTLLSAELGQRSMKTELALPLTFLAVAAMTGCVVSTYGGPGSTPEVPLPPSSVMPEAAASTTPEGPAEVGARHILIAYKGAMRAAPYIDRTKEQAGMLASELQEKALSGADFEELARKHSDDPGSASSGGSLGTFERGQMVKEFSDAAFSLPIGGVSEVVESPFGFHVIQRTE